MASSVFRIDTGLEIDDAVQILTNTAAPDTQADAIAAPVGSLWLLNAGTASTTRIYQKYQQVTSDKEDWRDVTSSSSWREPARVVDTTTYADITAAETAANVGDTVDGVTIVAGDRLLFTDLTAGADNVYIVSGGTGAWIFTEDTNSESDGDALFIEAGTSADTMWMYTGTVWQQFGSGSSAEEGFIRAFIGKDTTGSETPDYDDPTGGSGPGFDFGAVIGVNDNLELAIAKLGNYLSVNTTEVTVINNTTAVDTLPAGEFMGKWLVRVNENLTPTKVRSFEVYAVRDSVDAVDYTRYAQLNLGASIVGLTIVVTSVGTALTLTVTTTPLSDFRIKRVAVM